MNSHSTVQVTEARALHTAAVSTCSAMDLLADACRGAGQLESEERWSGRSAGMQFAAHRVLRLSEIGESPAIILLALADLGEQVRSKANSAFASGWLDGVEEVCRLVFLSGLEPAPETA